MSHPTYTLWCFIEGDDGIFCIVASSDQPVEIVRQLIKAQKGIFLKNVEPSDLTLFKVDDIHFDFGLWQQFEANKYRPPPPNNDDNKLHPMTPISDIWSLSEAQHNGYRLNIYIRPPSRVSAGISATYPSDVLTAYNVAQNLYKATWQQDIESRLQDVEGFKYLPADQVESLQLQQLGCKTKVMLIREDYIFALKTLEERQKEDTGGVVVTGHPGIGKSVFIFYVLLRRLSKGLPVALQLGENFLIFSQGGVEIHRTNSLGLFFSHQERTWALSDSTQFKELPCSAFQEGSRMGRAWIIHATSPSGSYDRLRKECSASLFTMACITREETRALSIVKGLDTEMLQTYFSKWGPSARTCLALASKRMSEDELDYRVSLAVKKFAEDPVAATKMEANPKNNSHYLFTTVPANAERDVHTLRVATPHLRHRIQLEIANVDAARQASFYTQASGHPFFRGAFGYLFEKFFYIWLSSNPNSLENELLCIPASSRPTRSTHNLEPLRLQPVGWKHVIVHGGEKGRNGYGSANKHETPFAWIPASRSDAAFDAVICTDTHIITVQATVSAEHSMKTQGITTLKTILPKPFQKKRRWIHVFVTNHHDTAAKLRSKTYPVAKRNNISICSAVLDISLFNYPPETLKYAKAPAGKSVGSEDDDMDI